MQFVLGLECGGLMEYEGSWELHDVLPIEADTLDQAKLKWAELTGVDKSPTWNPETKTDWGFAIVEESEFFKQHPGTGYKVERN